MITSVMSPERYAVEIDERVFPGSQHPAALNTPLDQIPLTLADLYRIRFQADVAIKEIEGYDERKAAA